MNERAVGCRPRHEREHDEREHRQRRTGAESRGERIRHRHPEHRCKTANASERPHDEPERDVGVEDEDQDRSDDDHQAGDDPGREVHRELSEDLVPQIPRQHQQHDDRASAERVGGTSGHAEHLQERDQAEQHERHAEHHGGRGAGVRAGHDQQRAEHDCDGCKHEPAPATSGRRLREIANRSRDVHDADAPRRHADDHEGEEQADREGDDEAPRRHGELDLEPRVGIGGTEGARHHRHHPERDECAEQRADESGGEVVGRALEREHLHEVAAPRSDRPSDPELTPALGGEHHEDQEDQENAGGDREGAERREERHERVPRSVRVLDRVALERFDLEAERGSRPVAAERPRRRSAARPPTSPPRFETSTALIRPS